MRTVGERIKNAREKRGLSRAALAEEVGVSAKTLGRWERGQTGPLTIHRMADLSEVLGCSVEWLVCGDGWMNGDRLDEEAAVFVHLLERLTPDRRRALHRFMAAVVNP